MPNDINGINSGRSQSTRDRTVSNARQEGKAATDSHGTGSSHADSVSLTSMAERLQRLEQNLAGHSEVDQARVDQIRDTLSRGEYKVDPGRVADKMMDFEKDF